jgi:hypothetical protein
MKLDLVKRAVEAAVVVMTVAAAAVAVVGDLAAAEAITIGMVNSNPVE